MKKTIPCDKCNGRGYFIYEQNCTTFCGVTVCRCEVCQGKGMIEAPVTNADHIRSMTDEELADYMSEHSIEDFCYIICGGECKAIASFTKTPFQRCREIVSDWLKQPYGGDT